MEAQAPQIEREVVFTQYNGGWRLL